MTEARRTIEAGNRYAVLIFLAAAVVSADAAIVLFALSRTMRLFQASVPFLIAVGLGLLLCHAALVIAVLQRWSENRRLAIYRQVCHQVRQGQLESRLPESADGLAAEVNQVWEHLANLMGFLQEQSDHIRHEYGNSAGRMGVHIQRIRGASRDWNTVSRSIDDLDRERRHFLAMTEAILNLWRARQGGQKMMQQNLALLVGEVVDVLETKAELKNVSVASHIQTSNVTGDAQMLTLLILNLLENAIKYTPAGGYVEIGCLVKDGTPKLFVDDSGPGVPADVRADIMKPRVRLDSNEDGKGYGLAIVDAIVTLHRARLHVDQAALGGARFEISFPATA